MTNNKIFVPTTGTNPKKFESIREFAKHTPSGLCKLVIDGFHNAGKVRDFVRQHAIAQTTEDYNWNGYGYADHDNLFLLSRKDAKAVKQMLDERSGRKRRALSHEKKCLAWARRLVKFTGISLDDAVALAAEKENDLTDRINALIDRQNDHYSVCREKLISKLERTNPLRRIEDENHAYNILSASVRHHASDYEDQLGRARELAEEGIIDRDQVREYARDHTTYRGDIGTMFFNE